MRLATQILLFGQEKWIMQTLENAYKNVDHIYIAYSKMPWQYNSNARGTYKNTFDLEKITTSPYIDKITIIEGDWYTEESQRKSCFNAAITDGYHYMMIQDADEFYSDEDYAKIKQYVKDNPHYAYYTCYMKNFWKTFDKIILGLHGEETTGEANIVINLDKGEFGNKRNIEPKLSRCHIPGVICYHGSYVLSDEELQNKLKTWGHHNDFDIQRWYQNVWLKWQENDINLHPLEPPCWSKVVSYDGTLPDIIRNHYL